MTSDMASVWAEMGGGVQSRGPGALTTASEVIIIMQMCGVHHLWQTSLPHGVPHLHRSCVRVAPSQLSHHSDMCIYVQSDVHSTQLPGRTATLHLLRMARNLVPAGRAYPTPDTVCVRQVPCAAWNSY